MIAFDLETTRIQAGTPRVLYLTAYGESWQCSMPIRSLAHLARVLEARFLTDENEGARFVGWNSNAFDTYFIARALLRLDGYTLRPYLTRSKSLRGLAVLHDATGRRWEFLDGLAMTGLGSTECRALKDFLRVFAPAYEKLTAPAWDQGEQFDARNPEHQAYALRDSEGLYHGMRAVEAITLEHFGLPLAATVGNIGIKAFQQALPAGVNVWEPPLAALEAIRSRVYRGGFCALARRYRGPVWKYDLNQAYAAAMREASLPCGRCVHVAELAWYLERGRRVYEPGIYRVRAELRPGALLLQG
jgi:hypothetical protein